MVLEYLRPRQCSDDCTCCHTEIETADHTWSSITKQSKAKQNKAKQNKKQNKTKQNKTTSNSSFCSRWHRRARKGPYAILSVSQQTRSRQLSGDHAQRSRRRSVSHNNQGSNVATVLCFPFVRGQLKVSSLTQKSF